LENVLVGAIGLRVGVVHDYWAPRFVGLVFLLGKNADRRFSAAEEILFCVRGGP